LLPTHKVKSSAVATATNDLVSPTPTGPPEDIANAFQSLYITLEDELSEVKGEADGESDSRKYSEDEIHAILERVEAIFCSEFHDL
jgi:hypothetical protein